MAVNFAEGCQSICPRHACWGSYMGVCRTNYLLTASSGKIGMYSHRWEALKSDEAAFEIGVGFQRSRAHQQYKLMPHA